MDFDEDDHLTSIRHAIREICADFDDGYWRDHDSRHEFPWEFYEALAKGGWVGVAIPGEYGGGGRRRHRGVGGGRGGGRLRRGDERGQREVPGVGGGVLRLGPGGADARGSAYAREYNVGRYFLESRLMEIAPVPQEMVLNYISEHVLHLPRSY
jgi:alkylation response protein AidB-like acyl-CoA dehydrogenase